MVQWRALVLLALLALLVQGRASPLPSASAPAPAPAPAPKEGEDEEKMYRLPDDQRILPSLYEITLSPQYTSNGLNGITVFQGKVKITANVVAARENGIYLNCDNLIDIAKEDVSITFESYPTTPSPSSTDSSSPGSTDSSSPGSTDSSSPGSTDSSSSGSTDSSRLASINSPPEYVGKVNEDEDGENDNKDEDGDKDDNKDEDGDDDDNKDEDGDNDDNKDEDGDDDDNKDEDGDNDGNTDEDGDNDDNKDEDGDDDDDDDDDEGVSTLPKYTGIKKLAQDILLIELDGQIKEGAEIIIEISYSRDFQDNELNGFYRSTYLDASNVTKTVLATQFEWTYARKAFPCFDEPEFKAEFKLSIDVTDGVKAIANTQGTEEGKRITFDVSPVMPTYLLAFVVYEKASFDTKEADDAKFRTFGRLEAINDGQGELSQADGPAMIAFLEAYTKITYYGDKDNSNSMGMKKMDQVAIPDFSSGAMENWGLVTYRESALLFEKGGSEAAKKRVSQVIAHELAHQWFGNWVTTKWWNSIWLNEGFADLFEHEVMHSRYGNWKMRERMVLDEQMYAFDADSDALSPALTLDEDRVNSPEEIGAHFGTITYSKGGSILRQIRNVLGDDAFQRAVEEYLANKRFQSAEPEELIEKFVDHNNDGTMIADDKELTAILENWTKNSGYPVVTVQKEGAKDIKLTQSRFLFSTNATAQAVKYDVYLTWRTDTATGNTPTQPSRPQNWLKRTDENKVIQLDEGWSWVILNLYQGGYYRVDYSTELWEALKTALSDHDQLSKVAALDRAALINNALSLVRDVNPRNMNYNDVFHFLLFLKHDEAFEPWAALRYSLGHVVRMMGNTTVYRNFVRNVVEDTYGKLTPDNLPVNNNVQITHHVNVMTVACGGNYGPCLDWAETKLKNYLQGTPAVEVNVNLQSIAYCYGLKNSPSLWDALWQKYLDALKDMTRRQLIASALGCVNDAAKLRTYLDKSLQDEVPKHEKYLVFSAVYANLNGGPDAALEFLTAKGVDEVAKSYGEDRMKSLLNGLAGYVNTPEGKQKLQNAIGCSSSQCESPYKSCLDTVDTNVKWREANGEKITEGLTRASASAASLATGLVLLCAAVLRYLR